jgi:hypothetical protein
LINETSALVLFLYRVWPDTAAAPNDDPSSPSSSAYDLDVDGTDSLSSSSFSLSLDFLDFFFFLD